MTWCNKFGMHYLFNDVPSSLLSVFIPCIILYEHFGVRIEPLEAWHDVMNLEFINYLMIF